MSEKKGDDFIVYRKKDMDIVIGFVDGLECKGIAAARRISLVASILESGKPLMDDIKEEKEGDG